MTLPRALDQLRSRVALLLAGPIVAGALAYGATYLVAPTYTAVTTFLIPQQQQSSALSALASLGSLSGLAAGGVGKSPADQYVALMESVAVADRIIDRFELMRVYEADFRVDARRQLSKNLRVQLGRKDGLVRVEVDDSMPSRSAEMANQFVQELRQLTANLSISEAQQRRVFFEKQLQQTQERLTKAQRELEASGISPGTLRAEPKSAADRYGRLQAELVSAEVRLRALGSSLTDSTPEVQRQKATVAALRGQLANLERTDVGPKESQKEGDYIGRYREFKYQEALFEVYARQFELARVDESREGMLIQVVDTATAPERRSRPRRLLTAALATVGTFACLLLYVLVSGRPRSNSNELDL